MGTSLHITHNALWVDRGEQAMGVVLATCTWARTRWPVRSSVPRAPRWTSWCPTPTASLWVCFYTFSRSLQLLYIQFVSSTSIHSVGLFNFYTLSRSLQLLYIQSQSVSTASIHSVCLSSLICSLKSAMNHGQQFRSFKWEITHTPLYPYLKHFLESASLFTFTRK